MAVAYPHPNVRPVERVLTAAAGIGLLALAARFPRVRRPLVGMSTAVLLRSVTGFCPAYAAAGVPRHDVASTDTRHALAGSRGEHVDSTVRIARASDEVYGFWRDLSRLAHALPPSIAVDQVSDTESRWTISKAGMPVARWTARIINDEPGRLIAWKTIGAAGVVSAGSVHFDPADEGRATDVHVRFQYAPPLGRPGAALADIVGQGAEAEVRTSLQHVKHLLEGRGRQERMRL